MDIAPRRSFTLIELLVVLAIVAILSTVVVITLNPVELLRQARDSNRFSDLASINMALNLFNTDVTGGFMGTSSVMYISVPDTSSVCANLGLPALPSGWRYNCVTSTSTKNVDGTGWIPVNLRSISAGNPISNLPVDPINSTTSRNYYTYVSGGSWQLTTNLESQKYAANEVQSGGADPAAYTVGSNLSIAPFASGLVGWWKLDEGSGTTTADSSGYGYTALFATTTPALPTWDSNCKSGSCLNFTKSDIFIPATSSAPFNIYPGSRTINFWLYNNATTSGANIVEQAFGGIVSGNLTLQLTAGTTFNAAYSYDSSNVQRTCTIAGNPRPVNNWYNIAIVQARAPNSGSSITAYINGTQVCSVSGYSQNTGSCSYGSCQNLYFGARGSVGDQFFVGNLDDIRVYNRALSAAEIQAIYNATK